MKSIEKTDTIETGLIYQCILRSSGIYGEDDTCCVVETTAFTCSCLIDDLGILLGFEI